MSFLIKCASVAAIQEELAKPRGNACLYAVEAKTAEGAGIYHEACFANKCAEFAGKEDLLKANNIYTILCTEDDCQAICAACGEPINGIDDTTDAEAWNDIPT